jgi:hypothetical protein
MNIHAWHQGKWYGETFAMLPNGVIVEVHRFAGAVTIILDDTPLRFLPAFTLTQIGERNEQGYPQYVTDGEGHLIYDTLPDRTITNARPTRWTTDELVEVSRDQVAFDHDHILAYPIVGPMAPCWLPSVNPARHAFFHR